jgi:hypothetical protein
MGDGRSDGASHIASACCDSVKKGWRNVDTVPCLARAGLSADASENTPCCMAVSNQLMISQVPQFSSVKCVFFSVSLLIRC